ncbi:MAG: beta-galactosidase [Anaerolineales bacterium]|nr:beta-galactosidase [Anaerolineales bacterium]
MVDLRFRQIHMDFHTSENIGGVGQDFDPEVFAATLERAHVDSVTCFARCHHGWIYTNTALFPERRHPHLERDLLKEQIEACHARDIRVPIYTTVQWDHFTANLHPEWLVLDERGCPTGTPLYEAGFYRRLCVNSPYVDFLKAHVEELFELLPVDGFFFDIVAPQDCSCRYCRAGMAREGLEPADPAARRAYAVRVMDAFKLDMTAFVQRFNPDCTVFYNAGHIGPEHRVSAEAYSHFELESLPSGGWGYVHFPAAVRYARGLGHDCMGMTGKFHTSWGDFHSFKNPAALQFECFQMLAQGAKCSIGDQLHPSGAICQTTYDLVGGVYAEVAAKEPWCQGARAVTEIGVLTPAETSEERVPAEIIGAVRMLQEGGHQFDILDSLSDFERYSVLVLPDRIPVSAVLAGKLSRYLEAGGALIASHCSGLNELGDAFALDALGVSLVGEAPYSPDFVLPAGEIGRGLPETEHVMYMRGMQVDPMAGSEVLAQVVMPYFNRTYKHFCSHRHTPSAGVVGYPAVVRRGRVIYFAHPIFAQYARNAPRWCKQLLLNALDMLLPEPLVRVEAPSAAIASLTEQEASARLILHLLYYVPERRGEDFDVIEDVVPLRDVAASVRVPRAVSAVACVPSGEPLAFTQTGGRVRFVVPEVRGHQMVAITYA